MMLTLVIPDEIAADFGCDENAVSRRLQADLALMYYKERRISLGRAAELSGLKRWQFEKLVAETGIERDYTDAELDKDLAWAAQFRPIA